MGKVRVYSIADELELPNKVVIQALQELGYSVKSQSSTLPENEAEKALVKLKDHFKKNKYF
jgi:hypothetical protein